MARRTPRKPMTLVGLSKRIAKDYLQSPLAAVARQLICTLEEAEHYVVCGSLSTSDAETLADAVSRHLLLLPRPGEMGDRFLFDAAMIQEIADSWSRQRAIMSGMIIPQYSDKWGHTRICLPSFDAVPCVDLVFMPAEDVLDQVALTEYPWLCHELAHSLFLRNGTHFAKEFALRLEAVKRDFVARGMADSTARKGRAERTISQLERHWDPTLDQQNWAFEMAADIVALWTCGPAFVAAFSDQIEEPDINPYHVDTAHPSYEIRTLGLIRACSRLGWDRHVWPLKKQIERWSSSRGKWKRDNTYVSLRNEQLIEGSALSAMETCSVLGLPWCDQVRIDDVRGSLEDGRGVRVGIDLIVAAWWYWENDKDGYDEWERSTVRGLVGQFTL